MIWLYLGNEIGVIKNYLNNNQIPTAGQLRYNKQTFWENKTVKQILKNEIYIGNTIQNKRNRISYKNRRLKANPKEKWVRIENTHEPIIDKSVFDRIQKMIIVQSYNRNEKKNHFLLDGLLICYECKHKIGIRGQKNGQRFMICNNYRRNSKIGLCTSHGFNYNNLEEKILKYIQQLFLKISCKKIEININKSKSKYDYNKILKKLEIDIKLIKDNLDKMYLDKLNNKISEEMYQRIFDKLIYDIKQKENEYQKIENTKKGNLLENTKEIEKVIKEFLELKEVTPEFLKVLINRIEIHQDKKIDIYFNFKSLNDVLKENLALINK